MPVGITAVPRTIFFQPSEVEITVSNDNLLLLLIITE